MKMDPRLRSVPLNPVAIRGELERVLISPGFEGTPQQVALLKYVVEQTLTGKADRIKAYTVATEVLGRKEDFDQNIDPIVSIQAGRLRRYKCGMRFKKVFHFIGIATQGDVLVRSIHKIIG